MPRGAPKARLVHDVPKDDGGWFEWTSSNVIGGRYDPDGGVLWIRFGDTKTGKPKPVTYYVYSGVPRGVWNGLLDAGSKGEYHAKHIKWAYPFAGPLSPPD